MPELSMWFPRGDRGHDEWLYFIPMSKLVTKKIILIYSGNLDVYPDSW